MQGRKDRVKFPRPGPEASEWSHVVRFIRLGVDKENGGFYTSYKYVQHMFDKVAGQAPYEKKDGSIGERNGLQFAYCQGSPVNPYFTGKTVPVNEEGVDDCRSIILPNGVPLHDIDQGGTMHECCLVWSWTNGHVASLDRKIVFFDALSDWAKKLQADPFYYDEAHPGFDVILSTPARGTAYTYSFDQTPRGQDRDILSVKALMQAQFAEVKESMIPVRTTEQITKSLGLGVAKPSGDSGMDEPSPFESDGGGSISRADGDDFGAPDSLDDDSGL
ncbi:MAG: hypothetical protein ACYC63_04935 [Armatimonadota bacterium]